MGPLELVDVSKALLGVIDAEWRPKRPTTDVTTGWVWSDIVADLPETLVLVDANKSPAAIWCSAKRLPIALPGGKYYRLDNVEVRPTLRGTLVGGLTFGVIATRALELKATGMVLNTWETHVDYYTALGGRQELATGWTAAPDLVPFVFDETALVQLKDMANAFISEKSAG
jgi:hypothetical protein